MRTYTCKQCNTTKPYGCFDRTYLQNRIRLCFDCIDDNKEKSRRIKINTGPKKKELDSQKY